jgi:hypothetical protein
LSKKEECIRQALIQKLIFELGFPRELISIEKELSKLPHLSGKQLPKRRVDLVCFTQNVYPLLVIECKAIPLSEKALDQVLGYNYYIQAEFVAISNGQTQVISDKEGKRVWYEWMEYRELVREAALPCF